MFPVFCNVSLQLILYNSFYLLFPHPYLIPLHFPLPTGNDQFFPCINESVSFLLYSLIQFVVFSSFCIKVISYSIHLSLSDLFHLVAGIFPQSQLADHFFFFFFLISSLHLRELVTRQAGNAIIRIQIVWVEGRFQPWRLQQCLICIPVTVQPTDDKNIPK